MKTPNEYLNEAKEEVSKKHKHPSWKVAHFNESDTRLLSYLEEAALLAIQNQASNLKKELREKIKIKEILPINPEHSDFSTGFNDAIDEILEIINNS